MHVKILKVALIYHEDKIDPEDVITEYLDRYFIRNAYLILNGFLHEKLHNVPKISDTITPKSLKFTVEQVEKNRSTKICIQKIKNKSEDDN
ncbi:MAG: hypothetical protein OEX98_01440 [Nitrosopumilus sp.]|nr:hypothetical protein [Nitrosopumilus sp.]